MTGTPPPLSAPPEVSIGFSIECIRSNHMYGWHEIAGTRGFVNCGRDGTIATRIDGAIQPIQHHRTVEAAALRIAETDAT